MQITNVPPWNYYHQGPSVVLLLPRKGISSLIGGAFRDSLLWLVDPQGSLLSDWWKGIRSPSSSYKDGGEIHQGTAHFCPRWDVPRLRMGSDAGQPKTMTNVYNTSHENFGKSRPVQTNK